MERAIPAFAFVISVLLFSSAAVAQTSTNPTIFLSSNEVSIFNGDQDSIDATVKNNDLKAHTFTVSVFPSSLDKVFAGSSLNHLTLAGGESANVKITFSSLFEAEFVPRQFSITASATDDSGLSATKETVVHLIRRSPVFVLSLVTDKFSYKPNDVVNITSVVANQGGDTFDQFSMQTLISKGGEFLKRFETGITFLPQKSRNVFGNLYTLEQFAEPGVYSAQLILKDATGQTLSIKSVNFKVEEVSKASQEQTNSAGIFDTTSVITAKNEGNSPSDLQIVTLIPSFAREILASDAKPTSIEEQGSSLRVAWTFKDVPAGQTAKVVYKLAVWKIWASVLIILIVVYFAFRLVFTVRISKWSKYLGPITKDSEVPVSIEVANRSLYEVKDLVVKDFVPPIARVVTKFETVKPVVRETVGGTELVWKFDSLRAGEERVMAYRIKPKMDVIGTLKLNPATLAYSDRKRRKKSAASGIVIVKES